MSTFDTLMDWREGLCSDTEALLDCLINLAEWCPIAGEQEAYQALTEIVINMRKREDDDYEREYQRGESTRFLVQPRYPMPAIRMRTFDSLVKLGFTSAENNFDVDTVFEYYIKN